MAVSPAACRAAAPSSVRADVPSSVRTARSKTASVMPQGGVINAWKSGPSFSGSHAIAPSGSWGNRALSVARSAAVSGLEWWNIFSSSRCFFPWGDPCTVWFVMGMWWSGANTSSSTLLWVAEASSLCNDAAFLRRNSATTALGANGANQMCQRVGSSSRSSAAAVHGSLEVTAAATRPCRTNRLCPSISCHIHVDRIRIGSQ